MNLGAELTSSAALGSRNETGLLTLPEKSVPNAQVQQQEQRTLNRPFLPFPSFPLPLADSKSPGTEIPLMSGVCVGTPGPFRRRLARLWKMSQNEHRTCGAGRCEEEEVCLLCLSSHRKTVPASPALQPKTNRRNGCSLPCVVWTDDSQAMVFQEPVLVNDDRSLFQDL